MSGDASDCVAVLGRRGGGERESHVPRRRRATKRVREEVDLDTNVLREVCDTSMEDDIVKKEESDDVCSVQDAKQRRTHAAARRRATSSASIPSHAEGEGEEDAAEDGTGMSGMRAEEARAAQKQQMQLAMYPPLRPTLGAAEQQRAAAIMQRRWKTQEEQTFIPAEAAHLRIPLVPQRRFDGGKRGRKAVKQEKEQRNEDEDEEEVTREEADRVTGDANASAASAVSGVEEKLSAAVTHEPSSTTAAGRTTVVMTHPLEVRDLATSLTGRRYMAFMLKYTSERTKQEMLRTQPGDKEQLLLHPGRRATAVK